MIRRGIALALLALALPFAAGAADETAPGTEPKAPQTGWELPLPAWIDRLQLGTSTSLIQLSEQLDSFFPNPDNLIYDYRRTRLEFKIGFQLAAEKEAVLIQKFDGRIALPRLEERLSLFITEEDPEDDIEEPSTIFIPRQIDTDMRFGLTTGLRANLSEGTFHTLQNRIGARLYPDWQRFEELGGFLRIPLGNFLLKPGQLLFWRDGVGFGETTLIDLDRPLDPTMLVRLHSEGTTSETSAGFEYREAIYFFHQITPKKGYSVVLEANGATEPQSRFNDFLAGVAWRQRIHKEWLFYELGCNLHFRREDDFELRPALYFTLSTFFRDDRR